MIVNYTEAGWEVITQRAHGVLAAQLANHWKFAAPPARWTETLLAIAEHDDAEMELEGEELITEAGGPINFVMKNFELPHCEQLYRMAISKSQYVALLTSMHMEFLYHKEEKNDPIAHRFLTEQRKLRTKWKKELHISSGVVQELYDLLEWCDACSLLLCQRNLQPEKRSVEVSTGPDKKMYGLKQTNESTITVEPWPFEKDEFIVHVESRLIVPLQFTSSAAFRKAFYAAPVTVNSWKMQL